MIGRLRGTLAAVGADTVLIDVGGVGYDVAVTSRTFVELPGVGSEVVLHTHLQVREDLMALFGFTSSDERDLFRLLLGVSGLGPKVALAILATMSGDDLRRVVATDDVAALTAVPGIGKRSAQKLPARTQTEARGSRRGTANIGSARRGAVGSRRPRVSVGRDQRSVERHAVRRVRDRDAAPVAPGAREAE